MEPEEPLRTQILYKLIELVKPDGSVWCDGASPKIRYLPYGEPTPISWNEAKVLTGLGEPQVKETIRRKMNKAVTVTHIPRKPMTQAEVSDEELDRRALAMKTVDHLTITESDAWRKKA